MRTQPARSKGGASSLACCRFLVCRVPQLRTCGGPSLLLLLDVTGKRLGEAEGEGGRPGIR